MKNRALFPPEEPASRPSSASNSDADDTRTDIERLEAEAQTHTPQEEDGKADVDHKQPGLKANALGESAPKRGSETGHNPAVMYGELPADAQSWKTLVAPFQTPSVGSSVWQVVNTLVPYAILWYLMYRSLTVSYWITLPLAILTAGFLVRVFIILHDCGHGSFFHSRKANNTWGFITGVLCFTPYAHWRWKHAMHHASAGNLDKRGMGDVWTLTVREYLESSRWKRFAYRLARNPIILFVLAPLFLFLVQQRFPSPKASRRERRSVYETNLAVLTLGGLLGLIFGFEAYLIIQLTVLMLASAAGVWLFYIQHQFEDVYWSRHEEWDYTRVALQGSSFYKLPKVLQWFTGSIGFHHIHHLTPGIPNYNLEKCHRAIPLFQTVKPLTLFSSLKSLTFRLWDEQCRKLVGYSHLRTVRGRK